MTRGHQLPLEELAPFLLDPPPPPARLDWREVFGNDHPVELEVGFGKGLFLVTQAQAHPDVNFAGIEIVRKYQLFSANRIAKRQLKNVRLLCGDARQLLRDVVPAKSVHTLHVYFPDPWWKTRHHKRRLFTAGFADACAQVLRPGGRLFFVSDVEAYFQTVAEMVREHPSFRILPPPTPGTPEHDLDYLTNFERKFRKEGRPIYRMALEVVEGPQ